MFADDTNLFFKHKVLPTLFQIINDELINISNWFKLNKLIKFKNNYIFFPLKSGNNDLTIFIDDIAFEQVLKSNFLGVIIT